MDSTTVSKLFIFLLANTSLHHILFDHFSPPPQRSPLHNLRLSPSHPHHLQIVHSLHLLRSPIPYFTSLPNPTPHLASRRPLLLLHARQLLRARPLDPHLPQHHLLPPPNPASWNRLFSLLFPYNPVGTRFNIAANTKDIPRDQQKVAQHLYAAIIEFMELNPTFKSWLVYITSESYAGKYVPAIGDSCRECLLLRFDQQEAMERIGGASIGGGEIGESQEVEGGHEREKQGLG
ncbi:hypothetical protein TIFTF001_047928 [Ficus carica]|uniref:Carboxypeptidase n=1 Tax=Ficus carica TaxID=3494 RepID=A0AA88D7A5_FICCA|nr:hypothetical protein TIFTF001_047928 [Ficus carica]